MTKKIQNEQQTDQQEIQSGNAATATADTPEASPVHRGIGGGTPGGGRPGEGYDDSDSAPRHPR